MADGFIIGERIIYSAYYRFADGSALVVNFNRAGDSQSGNVRHTEAGRRMITTKPGDVILLKGEPRTAKSVEPYRQTIVAGNRRGGSSPVVRGRDTRCLPRVFLEIRVESG